MLAILHYMHAQEKKRYKKSGRKKPRRGDISYNPAPDSTLATE